MLLAMKTRNWCVSIRLLSQLNSRLLLVKLSVLQLFGLDICLKQFGLLLSKSVTQMNRTACRTMLGEGDLQKQKVPFNN